ncbi:hypothetical protein O181_034603 [Austropuccinia psidii MF-1]|uniref:Uncharacterized protein n=1 Tax=Austropuccinia psidii MF-1 TaxID=1389203 RepID=A0A9Q3H7H9_9BASI|nr:hypothetical protein [Austropuccinia psidii MF-1]
MLNQVESFTSYLYKYCDRLTRTQIKGPSSKLIRKHLLLEPVPSPSVDARLLDPPAYETPLPPPSYHSITGRLCLIDRNDHTFKIYQADLLSLENEWYQRTRMKADCLKTVPGGPQMSPRRIQHMRELFMSIVEHQPCLSQPGKPSCDCRILRWMKLKQEWLEVMYLLGNPC